MKHKILLNLIALSTLSGSMLISMLIMLLTARLATATTTIAPTQASCTAPVNSDMAVDPETIISDPNSTIQVAIQIDSSTETVVNESPMMDFTAAESDAAVALFGCDCPPCINALRQLQSRSLSQVLLSSNQSSSQSTSQPSSEPNYQSRDQPVPSNNQGHCWTSLQQRVSPQEAQDILQQLDVEETNQ